MALKTKSPFDWNPFSAGIGPGITILEFGADTAAIPQSDPEDGGSYLRRNKEQPELTSEHSQKAIVAALGVGGFFEEDTFAGQPLCTAMAAVPADPAPGRDDKPPTTHRRQEPLEFSERLTPFLLSRNRNDKQELLHAIFNSMANRLARTRPLLAHYSRS